MLSKQLKILVPKISDPRILFIIFTYAFLAYIFVVIPNYGRPITDFLYLTMWCGIFDLFLRKLYTGTWALPISGIAGSFGIFVVCDVQDIKFYIILAFLAIGSKAFLKINNSHIFNPTGFAIVIGTLGLPQYISNGGFVRWDGNLLHSLFILALGSILTIKSSRWAIPFSFILVSIFLSPIQGYLAHENPFAYIQTMLWQGSIIFMFFMISDPVTSPKKLSHQMLYGASLATITQLLRFKDYKLPEHIALLVVCLIYSIMDKKINLKQTSSEWKLREVFLKG